MKTILREHIPYGISLGVYSNPQEAISRLVDPHGTIHQVPDNLCKKGQESNLLELCKVQWELHLCFDVFEALRKGRKATQEKEREQQQKEEIPPC